MKKTILLPVLPILLALIAAGPSRAGSAGAAETPPGRSVFAYESPGGEKARAVSDSRRSETVVLSARSLPKGHRLREDDIYLAQVEGTRIPDGAIREAEEAVGKRLSRSIGPNLPIRERMLSETREIKRGRRVMLIAEANGLRISAPGETLENGRIDGYVKAVNLSSKKSVTGRLVDESTVRVDFK